MSHFSLNSATPGSVWKIVQVSFQYFNEKSGAYLALKKLKTCASSSADMTQLLLSAVLGDNGCCVSAANNNDSARLGSLYVGIEE